MKVNLQKIILIITSTSIAILFLNITLFAEASDSDELTPENYMIAISWLIDDYANGNITFDDFNSRSDALIDKYTADNALIDSEATKRVFALINSTNAIKEKMEVTAKDKIKDIWESICNKNNVPTETTKTPTTDMMGCGVKIVITYKSGSTSIIVGSYATLSALDSWGRRNILVYGEGGQYNLQKDGTYKLIQPINSYSYWHAGNPVFSDSELMDLNGNTYKLYGDIRFETGESFLTDDDYEYGTIYKFDDMTDKELEELIDDFQTNLENENPDLDEIEDILRAIYWKLKQQEDDTIKPNELDSLINSSINRLLEKDCACGDIFALLQDMKLCENVQDIRDKLFEIYPEYDFEAEISMIEELKLIFLAKWSFVEELRTLIYRFISSYEKNSSLNADNVIHVQYHPSNGSLGNAILNISGSYDIKFDIFKPYLPTVRSIIAAFIYLSFAWNTYRKIPSYIRGGDQT